MCLCFQYPVSAVPQSINRHKKLFKSDISVYLEGHMLGRTISVTNHKLQPLFYGFLLIYNSSLNSKFFHLSLTSNAFILNLLKGEQFAFHSINHLVELAFIGENFNQSLRTWSLSREIIQIYVVENERENLTSARLFGRGIL